MLKSSFWPLLSTRSWVRVTSGLLKKPFAICISPITHFGCPPKILLKHCFYNFSWDELNSQEKLKTKVVKIWGGKQGVLWKVCKWRIVGLPLSLKEEFKHIFDNWSSPLGAHNKVVGVASETSLAGVGLRLRGSLIGTLRSDNGDVHENVAEN